MQMRADSFLIFRSTARFHVSSRKSQRMQSLASNSPSPSVDISQSVGSLSLAAADAYDISLLITHVHCESMMMRELIEFVVAFIEGINQEISEMKLAVNSRARVCAEEFLKRFCTR